MTYLFTKTLSRRPEYNSLVEEFEDYDEEEIQNLEDVKEEYKRKKCHPIKNFFVLFLISLIVLGVIAIVLHKKLDGSTSLSRGPWDSCNGSTCPKLPDAYCNFGNVIVPKALSRLQNLLDSLKLLEENKTVLLFVPTSLKVSVGNRELQKFTAELETFNSLPMETRERLIVKTLVNNELALEAFRENLEVIRQIDKFDIDLNRVLTRAIACKS